MKGISMYTIIHLVLPVLLGGLAALVVCAAIKGNSLPLISTPRSSLIALLVIGLTMCFLGGVGQVGATGRWATPIALIGIFLGIFILIVIVSALAGWKLPVITGETQALKVSAILMAVKLILGVAGFFFKWL
jgi:hypothetical protein